MNAETKPTDQFERETCSRCGGSGNYSYCQMYGTTCFKCAGAKTTLTKRGAAAAAYLRQLRTVPASEIKVGDRIKVSTLVGGKSFATKIAKVLRIEAGIQEGESMVDGVMKPYRLPVIEIHTAVLTSHNFATSSIYRVDETAVQLEQFAAAMEYQRNLTKAGKPRKIAAKASA